MIDSKIGAIWWRVSSDDQLETSPDTQIQEALALAQQEGYQIPQEHILGTDWHSLSVWESPPMERLKELVRTHAIKGIFMYDADRGPSKPAHRLLLRALCEEHGVKIRCRYGQVPDGEMGEVMEFLNAWQKEGQVLRAQRGARDGMRDRVRLKGLPANGRSAFGYRWNGAR
ncbi:MAG: recombinase family protein, partial [Dehalococcoidia bacterium]